ncbi:hypothetical protein [Pseudomonas sp. nanlin1]|uniref:hypothetical protein n=1 Tax=Pseudomonas sp. nanlin1 TaxID=3040605 RepID=UPI00388FA91E
MNGLEDAKKLLVEIFSESGREFKGGEWHADYKLNWDEEYTARLLPLMESLSRAAEAKERGDRLMLLVALSRSCVGFMDMHDFFYDLNDDFKRLVLDEAMKWPEIPEDYKYD